jgi:hypothetical protein
MRRIKTPDGPVLVGYKTGGQNPRKSLISMIIPEVRFRTDSGRRGSSGAVSFRAKSFPGRTALWGYHHIASLLKSNPSVFEGNRKGF